MSTIKLASILSLIAVMQCCAEEPSALQKRLIGHWIGERNPKFHSYYAQSRRMVERADLAEPGFTMMDYRVWDEWSELRTLVLTVNDNVQLQTSTLVITFSEDWKTAMCREKNATGWGRSFRIKRLDDRTYPAKLPDKLRLMDSEIGQGEE